MNTSLNRHEAGFIGKIIQIIQATSIGQGIQVYDSRIGFRDEYVADEIRSDESRLTGHQQIGEIHEHGSAARLIIEDCPVESFAVLVLLRKDWLRFVWDRPVDVDLWVIPLEGPFPLWRVIFVNFVLNLGPVTSNIESMGKSMRNPEHPPVFRRENFVSPLCKSL
jgi:hypothetical protein